MNTFYEHHENSIRFGYPDISPASCYAPLVLKETSARAT